MNRWKGLALVVVWGVVSCVRADMLSLGAEFEGWNANTVQTYSGDEFWMPLSFSLTMDKGFKVYGQTEFGTGSYTDATAGTGTIQLTNFSDSVLGTEFAFTSFSVPAMLNVALNLPTGDPTWEFKQVNGNLPSDFVESRYRGRGFGVSALYGLAFPAAQGEEYGLGIGYLYSGAFNPSYPGGLDVSQFKMGDSFFVSLNHAQKNSGDNNEIFRLSAYYSLPSQVDSQNDFQLGLNFNASYGWYNPSAFSLELGGQAWLPGQGNLGGQITNNAQNYYGPRFYIAPTAAFGDLALTGLVKYVLPNGYAVNDPYYDGGGWMFSLGPSLRLKLDSASALRLTGSFDYIYALYGGIAADNSRVDTIYNRWMIGSVYEVKL